MYLKTWCEVLTVNIVSGPVKFSVSVGQYEMTCLAKLTAPDTHNKTLGLQLTHCRLWSFRKSPDAFLHLFCNLKYFVNSRHCCNGCRSTFVSGSHGAVGN